MIKQNEESGLVQRALNFIKSFGMRLLVHCIAIILAVQISGFSSFFSIFAVYLGLICLLARGTSMHFTWLMPATLGLVQLFSGLTLGLSFAPAIFLGGLQAYMQRLFIKKFKMGFEWIVSLFLIIVLPSIFPLANALFVLTSFAFLLFIGIISNQIYKNYTAKKEESKILEEKIKNLEEREKNKDPFEEYLKSIRSFYSKQAWLPQNLQGTLFSLTTSAEAIIHCMREDARDIKAGENFLDRYLPATHAVLDNYRRHQSSPQNEAVTNALAQSEDLLIRLDKAFAQEHEYLLRNDVDDFSANLRVLDTLLKMEGR